MSYQGNLQFILPDGDYEMSEVMVHLRQRDFKNEKDLCDYIELHIEEFCLDCLGLKYKAHTREYKVAQGRRNIKGTKRIDFLIISEDGQKIGLECKHPTVPSEVSYAIGQALTYLVILERMKEPLDKIFIVTTMLDWPLPFVIDRFNLPVGLIGFDKQKFVTFQHGSTVGK